MDERAIGLFRDGGAAMAGADRVMAGAGAHGVQQEHLQVAAVDGELRRGVAGEAAERLAVDELAEAVEERRVRGGDAGGGERRFEAEGGQLLGCVGQDVDADADRADLGGLLIDREGDAGFVQAEAEGQPAYSGAHDDHAFHATLRHDDPQTCRRSDVCQFRIVGQQGDAGGGVEGAEQFAEQGHQGGLLVAVQRLEQTLAGGGGGVAELFQHGAAFGGEHQAVAPAIGGIDAAADQAARFELAEDEGGG
jgi:hypothetical protein